MAKKSVISLVFFAVTFIFNSSLCMAAGSAGFEVGLDGAYASGKGLAVVADPYDATTLAYNPAGLSSLDSSQMTLASTFLAPAFRWEGQGTAENSSVAPAYIPSFFMAVKTPVKPLTLGFGMHTPFGLANQYESDGKFKYLGVHNEIRETSYLTSLAWQANDKISIGAGLAIADVHMKQVGKLNATLISNNNGLPGSFADTATEMDISGRSYGWNAGVLMKVTDRLTAGAFYRSMIKTQLEGEYSADNISGVVMQSIFGGSSFQTNVETELKVPDSAVIGALYRVNDKLDAELDFGWTHWSEFKQFDFTFGTTNAVLNSSTPLVFNYQNTISINTGLSYHLNPNWTILGGYAYFERAASVNDYTTVVIDADRHTLSTGLLYNTGKFTIGLSYAAQILASTDVDNNVGVASSGRSIDGTFSGLFHVLVGSVTYRFS